MKTLLGIVRNPQEADRFIAYCARLAHDLNFAVKLIYIQSYDNYPMGDPGAIGVPANYAYHNHEELKRDISELLDAKIKAVAKELPFKVDVAYSIETGVYFSILDDLLEEKKIDMLAVEGHEEESFWSQTPANMELIRNLACPVWVIPKGIPYSLPNKVLYATDYHEADIATFKRLHELLGEMMLSLTALHLSKTGGFEADVKKEGFQELVRRESGFEHITVKALTRSPELKFAEQLNHFALENECSLIVLLKENRGFIDSIFHKSETRGIIKKAQIPVLIFHELKK